MKGNYLEIIKAYIDSSKSFIQLSSAGLALPVVLHSQVLGLFRQTAGYNRLVLSFVLLSWLCFLASIAAGTLYQYAAIKSVEYEAAPTETYVPQVLSYLIERRGPGVAYGVMVIAFYLGAVFVVTYSFIAVTT
jgi:hypothetical protein